MATFARGNPARWWKSRSCGSASRAPGSLFISPFRRWCTRAILLFLLLFLAGFWYITNPARVSRLSEALLSQVLGGNVTVHSGYLSFSGTLQLAGVEVRTADNPPNAASGLPIFTAEQIEARFDWLSLLSGKLSATQLVATTPVFHPIEDRETGHWNYERLRAPALPGGPRELGAGRNMSLPVVVLRDARVKWGEIRQNHVEQTAETIIEGEFTPDAAISSLYHFQVGRKDMGAVIRGVWDVSANTFTASTENVVMSDDLKNSLPRQAREWCDEHHLAGRLSELKMVLNANKELVLAVAFDDVSMMFMVQPEQGIAMGEERPAYPLDLRGVRGSISFDLSRPAMRINNLTGEVLGYKFAADCDIQGTSFDAPFTLNLRFPNALLGDRYPPLFMASLTSQDLIQRVAPHGRMDIAIEMNRPAAHAALQVNGTINCNDARMRFAHFPFPMEHLNGRITFDQQSVSFHNVTATADENDVLIDGSAGTTWGTRFIDFTVSSKNAFFDDRMAAALPEKFRPIWDLFSVQGHGGFVCKVSRSSGIFDQPKVVLDVNLDGGSGYLRNMPYPFTDVAGHLHFEADETRIEHITAVSGVDRSGRITIDGVVHHPGGDMTRLEPDLRVKADLPIDQEFMHALPTELTDKLGDAAVGGRLAFDGMLHHPAIDATGGTNQAAVEVAGDVNWRQGTLKMHIGQEEVAIAGIAARAAVSPSEIDLKGFAGDWLMRGSDPKSEEKIKLTLAGKLDIGLTGTMNVTADATGLTLPEHLPGFFPKGWSDPWKQYGPTGKIDLAAQASVTLHRQADASAGPPSSEKFTVDSYHVGVAAHDVSLKDAAWPDPLEKVNGSITATPGTITLGDMKATMGNLSFDWRGTVMQDAKGWGPIALVGAVSSKGLPVKWLDHLPAAIRDRLNMKQKDVTLSLRFESLTREAEGKPWEFEGSLESTNLATIGPMPMNAQRAILAGKGTFDPALVARGEALDFTAALETTNLTVNDHLLETLTASVEAAGTRHLITLSKLDGTVAGGVLQGTIRIRTPGEPASPTTASGVAVAPTVPGTLPAAGNEGGYTAELVMNNAELSRLLLPPGASEEEQKKIGTGRVDASLTLQETFGPDADRTGRGDLTVRDGNIYNVPLSMGLMQIATLRLPVANSFQQATMSYYLRNDEITFERIFLESEGINLAGLGTVSIAEHNINLSFLTESPHELFIPILSPIIRESRNGLLQLSVTGTVDSPKITPVPFSAIANALRAILPTPPRARADAVH